MAARRGWVVPGPDAQQGLEAYKTASETLGIRADKALLLSSGMCGLVGIAHSDEASCQALAQMTVRVWQLERHLGARPAAQSEVRAAKRRRTTI